MLNICQILCMLVVMALQSKKRVTIKPDPSESSLQIGNETIPISGASLPFPYEVKDIGSSTRAFLKKAIEISDRGIVIITEEDEATNAAPVR